MTLQIAALQQGVRRRLGIARTLVVAVAAICIAAAPVGTRVRAPFQVVDSAGKPLFTVTDVGDYGFLLHDASGSQVVRGAVKDNTSSIRVRTPQRSAATPGRSGKPADPAAEVVMGQIGGATPAIDFRTDGTLRVGIAVADGKPALNMGKGIVNITQNESGGGLLQLGAVDGTEVVGFVVDGDVGVVRAQPVGHVGVNLPRTGIFLGTGLPSTVICGIGCSQR